MSLYKHIREAWKKPKEGLDKLWTERLIAWRKEPTSIRIERPTRLDRARSVGYKAKQGFVMVRQRVIRGGHTRPKPVGGRRSKRYGRRLNLHQSYQYVAEVRAQKKFTNLVVLNSYWVAEDGRYRWFEVVLVDPSHPVIKSDKNLAWVTNPVNKSRVFQAKTSAGQRMRSS